MTRENQFNCSIYSNIHDEHSIELKFVFPNSFKVFNTTGVFRNKFQIEIETNQEMQCKRGNDSNENSINPIQPTSTLN